MSPTSARETILNLFREASAGYVSGAALSRELGVSRSAVWKQIEVLREQGYQIEAVPSRGYRLLAAPDSLRPEALLAGLATARVGTAIEYFPVLESTNLQAHACGEAGAAEGLVVIADRQEAGKGRMGRRWESPAGVNLYASVLLRPDLPPWEAPQLTYLSAVAVCRAIDEVTGLAAKVKWPNDILVNERKVAGLLNEMSSETDRVNFIVLGIGVNLNMAPDQFPDDLRYPATSLAIASEQAISRLDFTRSLLRHLDALYAEWQAEGLQPVLAAWRERSALTGREVKVDCQNRTIHGRVQGLGDDGALLVETADGTVERILAGDVRPV